MPKISPYLLVCSLIAVLLLPFWLQDGMFSDGTLYAAIARNMALGVGNFWQPQPFCSVRTPFFEQPPLVFWLQSFLFRIFGDYFLVERLYCALTLCFSFFVLHHLWQKIAASSLSTSSWLPMSLCLITPLFFWSFRHNMLENNVLLFCLIAVFFYYKTLLSDDKKGQFLFLCLGSSMVFLAILSKGLVGLFPLAIFFLHYVVYQKQTISQALLHSCLAILTVAILCLILIKSNPKAAYFITQYLDIQLIKSLKGEREISDSGNQLYLLQRLLTELIPILSILFFIFLYKKFKKEVLLFENKKEVLFWTLVGASASLPMLISPKQHGYYLVPALPYFAIAFTLVFFPNLKAFIALFASKNTFVFVATLFIISFLYGFSQLNGTSRDEALLHDIHLLEKHFPPCTIFGLERSQCNNYITIEYLHRFGRFDTDCDNKNATYFISQKENENPGEGYVLYKELTFKHIAVWERK